MFLAIGALALPRSRGVAGRMTRDAAAHPPRQGDGGYASALITIK
jgi:hypothetical protein